MRTSLHPPPPTSPQNTFFDLRERLVERKYVEPQLNISKVYHVFGRTQDRTTLEAAKIAQVCLGSHIADTCFSRKKE